METCPCRCWQYTQCRLHDAAIAYSIRNVQHHIGDIASWRDFDDTVIDAQLLDTIQTMILQHSQICWITFFNQYTDLMARKHSLRDFSVWYYSKKHDEGKSSPVGSGNNTNISSTFLASAYEAVLSLADYHPPSRYAAEWARSAWGGIIHK